jgi:hypothetical protein
MKNLKKGIKNKLMNFFVNQPKAFGFYKKALQYLDQHNIVYTPIVKYKKAVTFAVENVNTNKRHHATLKINYGKLYIIVKDFVDSPNDYEKQIENFEDFTIAVYNLKFEGKKND